jgi:hypothetical protein
MYLVKSVIQRLLVKLLPEGSTKENDKELHFGISDSYHSIDAYTSLQGS